MDFIAIAKKRYSVRGFLDKPIEKEKLDKLAIAASLTPSACNSQPWRIVIIQNKELLPTVIECGRFLGSNQFLKTAQAVLIVIETKAILNERIKDKVDSQRFVAQDLGALIYGVCLEASTLGIGSCIIGMFNEKILAPIVKLKDSEKIFGYIGLGYPLSNDIPNKIRKPLKDIYEII